jgi:hypothetical protein
MQLHPSAVIYFAFRRLGMALVIGLLIGVFVSFAVLSGQKSVNPPQFLPGTYGYTHQKAQLRDQATPARGRADANEQTIFIILGCGFLGCLVPLFTAYLVVRSYRISLEKEGILLQHGLVNINNEILLYDKIQDVVITRNLLERLLSLATLIIQNAMGQPEIIPGLGAADAESFRNDILSRIRR